MENHEDYLDALNEYGRHPSAGIPPVLEQYLNGVAKNGETLFQWQLLKPLIEGKMEQVIGELRQGLSSENIPPRPNVENVPFDVMHTRIMSALNKFSGAPFTIQRICELLIDPKRHYLRSDKFMRGLEKNVLVVSTVDPFGRKVVSDSNKPLVNGMDMNGSPFSQRDSSTPLPPVPDWVTSTSAMSVASVTSVVTSVLDRVGTARSHTSHDSSVQGISTEVDCMSSNGMSTGLVSSLYTDQGDQPLAVHAEEVVEETVVTMETNEVGSVATDGGEGLAMGEIGDLGNEDTNASSSSSSSSSSEEMVAQEITIPASKVSSSTGSPKCRPWAALTEEDTSDGLQDILSTSGNHAQSSTVTQLSDSGQPPLSWQPISTSQHTPVSMATDEAPEYALELVTPSSTVADTVTISTAASETVEESPVLDLNFTSNEAEQLEVEVSTVDGSCQGLSFVTDSASSQSGTDCEPSTETGELVQPAVDSVTVYTTSETPGYVQCDSVAGLERLVCSVSSQSPPSLTSSSPSSSISPLSALPHTTQAVSQSDSDEPAAKRCRLSDSSENLVSGQSDSQEAVAATVQTEKTSVEAPDTEVTPSDTVPGEGVEVLSQPSTEIEVTSEAVVETEVSSGAVEAEVSSQPSSQSEVSSQPTPKEEVSSEAKESSELQADMETSSEAVQESPVTETVSSESEVSPEVVSSEAEVSAPPARRTYSEVCRQSCADTSTPSRTSELVSPQQNMEVDSTACSEQSITGKSASEDSDNQSACSEGENSSITETDSGDCKLKEEVKAAVSPPSHKSSTDSTGFDTPADGHQAEEEAMVEGQTSADSGDV